MKFLQTITLLFLTILLSFNAQALDKPNIQVSAEGSIEVMPDYLQLVLEVEKTSQDKAATKSQVDKIIQQALNITADLAIKPEHLDASNISIYPQYKWEKNQQVFLGDTVKRNLTIKLYDLDRFTKLAEALSKIEITRMQQPIYGYDDLQALKNQALVKALNNAQTKAELIAKTLERKLGKAYQVTEGSATPLPVMRAMYSVAADSADNPAPASLEIKSQTIKTSVNVIYLLK